MLRVLLFAMGSTGLLALQSRLEHLHHAMPAWLLLGLFLLLCAGTGMGPFNGDDEDSQESSPLGHALLALQIPLGLLSLALCLYFLLRGRR
ncbi:MAG TPA: hypothetical protein VK195_13280 [Burkholderiaceae bacterium]|nr:hypothetical protein [Burkholderiaceae bacterium]